MTAALIIYVRRDPLHLCPLCGGEIGLTNFLDPRMPTAVCVQPLCAWAGFLDETLDVFQMPTDVAPSASWLAPAI